MTKKELEGLRKTTAKGGDKTEIVIINYSNIIIRLIRLINESVDAYIKLKSIANDYDSFIEDDSIDIRAKLMEIEEDYSQLNNFYL